MLHKDYSNAAQSPSFTIARLTQQSLPTVAELLVSTQSALPDDVRHFIKPQTLNDLTQHVQYGFPVLAAVENTTGRLAGVLLLTPAEKAEYGKNLNDYPKQLMESGAAVVQCVAVHPDFNGHGLMHKMLEGAEQLALKEGITDLLAKVANSNIASSKGFLKASFQEAAFAVDAKQGYDVTYWKKTCEGLAPKTFPIFNAPQHANDEPATFNCY